MADGQDFTFHMSERLHHTSHGHLKTQGYRTEDTWYQQELSLESWTAINGWSVTGSQLAHHKTFPLTPWKTEALRLRLDTLEEKATWWPAGWDMRHTSGDGYHLKSHGTSPGRKRSSSKPLFFSAAMLVSGPVAVWSWIRSNLSR